MSDLVDRLRVRGIGPAAFSVQLNDLLDEAADEIEWLQAENEHLRKALLAQSRSGEEGEIVSH
jgi:hypothetical protein